MASDFVRKQLRLIESRNNPALGWIDPAAMRESFGACQDDEVREEVLYRRKHLDRLARPSSAFEDAKFAIRQRQAIGEDEVPVAANDNAPKPKTRDTRAVRKSTGKFVRGSFAESLPLLMALRNTPDHTPAPVTSGWSVDPIAVIPEPDYDDEEGEENTPSAPIDMLLEITPSIKKIRESFEKGDVVRGPPQENEKTKKIAKRGPIVEIGKLKFSDGTQTEHAYRVRDGKLEAFRYELPLGAMLRTSEKQKPRIGGDAHATLSNRRLTEMLLGKDEEGNPNNWRPYIRKGDVRPGRNYTAEQSRAMIDEAIANTPVMPPVTYCPPGVASGTARYSDQFLGVVTASTGKGGAIQWVDVFEATRNHQEWQATLKTLDPKTTAVLDTALTARNLRQVGVAAGQSESYANAGGGKRALVAANDNLAAAVKKNAA